MKKGHVPIRKCAGCGKKAEKKEFIRIVKQNDALIIDESKKLDGRGVYLCFNSECLKEARKKRRIERTFSIKINEEFSNQLEKAVNSTE